MPACRGLERSALNAVQLKLRDAKAMLAQKLQGDDWRSTLTEDDRRRRPTSGGRRSAPTPPSRCRARARPRPDLSAQVASSQAYAETNPRVDNRNFFEKFTDKIKLASLTPDSGLFSKAPDLAALGYDSRTAVYDISAKALYLPSGVSAGSPFGHGPADGRPPACRPAHGGCDPAGDL